ncbi:MAG: DUF1501 domain-containing protein [Bacteroidia bacterium]
MQRRKFLKQLATLGAAPILLNGIPVSAMANSLAAQVSCSDVNDRVLVIIQLHGGNDGLNTLVPMNHYSTYANLRPNLKLPDTGYRKLITLDSTLPSNQQLGLHPELGSFKSMYDNGEMTIIQNAGYSNNNKSHFQAKDDWLTASDSITRRNQGWVGNFLKHQYPGYPDAYPNAMMPDPVGLEFGTSSPSLAFHRNDVGAMGLAMKGDPAGFFSLVSGVGGPLPTAVPNTHYGDKLQHIMNLQSKTSSYAQRIDQVYQNGSNHSSVTYPTTYHSFANYLGDNHLAPQLKTVARLISGGSKTKIFWVRLLGFDNHTSQVTTGDATMGEHAVLMYNMAEAVKAFQDDLAAQGLADRVLTTTFSEFGRRVSENGSHGTDHGTYAPMLLFGKHVNAGVVGNNSDLSNLTNNDLSTLDHDYRRVFSTILQDWLGADNQAVTKSNMGGFLPQKLSLIDTNEVAPASCYLTPLVTLPVSLLGFEAHVQSGGSVLCEWRTENEVNNQGFVLERSKDGVSYESIAEVPAAAAGSVYNTYDWEDGSPFRGISYYRIKQIDIDGTEMIHPKVAVHVLRDHDALSYRAYPNPAIDHFNLDLTVAEAVQGELRIANLMGQLVRSETISIEKGSSSRRINCAEMKTGMYIVQVHTAHGEQCSFQLVKK